MPLYPSNVFQRAKCRELIQHLELHGEWVARRTYKEAFFGGSVSDETKREVKERLAIGLHAVAQLASFSPYILGSSFTAADCVAYVHFLMIALSTENIFGRSLLDEHFPQLPAYLRLTDARPPIQRMLAERETAMAAFIATNVKYDG